MKLVEVAIESLAPGGDAVGREAAGDHPGRVTFVPLAAPGERVAVRLVREKKSLAWGELQTIVQPGTARVTPPCPLFGQCGGCQWQHVTPDAQRDAKRAIVRRALGAADVPLVSPSPEGRGYRERARLVVGQGEGAATATAAGQLGFRGRRTHDVVAIDECLLLAPELNRVLAAIRGGTEIGAWAPSTVVELQLGAEGTLVRISGAGAPTPARDRAGGPRAAELLAAWAAAGVVGVAVASGRGAADSAGLREVNIAEAGAPPLRVPAGAFAQVGRRANQALVGAVLAAASGRRMFGEEDDLDVEDSAATNTNAGPGGEVGDDRTARPAHGLGDVLELYAGSGNFTRHLALRANRLFACDADAAALERSRRTIADHRVQFGTHPPADFAPELVVVDPPRDGLDAAGLTMARTARRRIVYVSCDPQTLGRDAKLLRAAGFELQEALALDLMPHTFHVEVVARFDRRFALDPSG